MFVDVQNLYYSAKFTHSALPNFRPILDDVVRGRTLVRAIAYVIRAEEVNREEFFNVLSNMGFEIRAKDVQVFADGAKKGDWDIGIAMDAIELAPRLDTIIIVSGDGDFVPLVEHLRRALGCRVEAAAYGKNTSQKLIEAVDLFTDLDKNPKYLRGHRPHEERHGEIDTHAVKAVTELRTEITSAPSQRPRQQMRRRRPQRK